MIILAPPKTGTTALIEALGADAGMVIRNPPYLKHMRAGQVQRQILPLLKDGGSFEFFARMRHPMDWLGSWFRYRKGGFMAGRAESTQGISFEEFALEVMKDNDAPAYAQIGRQSRIFNGMNKKFAVNHLFRYEAEPAWSRFLSERLQRTVKTTRVNASGEAEMNLSAETRDRLLDHLRDEIGLWESAQH